MKSYRKTIEPTLRPLIGTGGQKVIIRRGGVPSGAAGLITIMPDGERDNISDRKGGFGYYNA
jgi:hypothetical protein